MTDFQMREAAFNHDVVVAFGQRLKNVWPEFEMDAFNASILNKLSDLQLKARSDLIRDALKIFLPAEFCQAIRLLLAAQKTELDDPELSGYQGFIVLPQADYVAQNGIDDFELSMHALYEMTKRFSSELAIRYFIETHPEQTMACLKQWATDENVHVRRLVSEGTRPRLPWAFRLDRFVKQPQPVIALITLLKNDTELYVRRSVANNLNDISKDHPDLVVEILTQWQDGSKAIQWLTRHALRTLLKKGHPGALLLLGFSPAVKVVVEDLSHLPSVRIGDMFNFEATLRSKEKKTVNVMIDYIIWYQKKNGTQSSKVFKWTTKTMKTNEQIQIKKNQGFAQFSTRKHYPGSHAIGIQINGQVVIKQHFDVIS